MAKKIIVNGKEVKPGKVVKLWEKIGTDKTAELIREKRAELKKEKKENSS